MKRIITVQGCLVLTVAALLVVTAGYAGGGLTSPQAEGSVRLAVSASDPIQILSEDGVTLLASGDAVDFGTVEVDYWGTFRMKPQKVFVANSSSAPQRVTVTGDMS